MKIHEYQAKEILRKYGVPFRAARWSRRWKRQTGPPKTFSTKGKAVVVVKAQIHAGGRGKGGGVKVVKIARRCLEGLARPSSACSWSRTRPVRRGRRCSAC